MFSNFRNLFLPLLVVMVISVLTTVMAQAAPGDAPLSRFDVEKIVHDYIVNNPKLILDAVDDYQRKNVQMGLARGAGAMPQQGQQGQPGAAAQRPTRMVDADAMQKNKRDLFADPGTPAVGSRNADIVIVEFMDYNCHFCKEALVTVQGLLDSDKRLRIVLKDFPILGPASETAAKWAIAANKQGKYFDYHSALMKNKGPLNEDILAKLAKDVGLDVDKLKADANSPAVQAQLDKNRTVGGNIGVRGTPAFIVGDEFVAGALPLSQIQQKIAEQRKKVGK